MATEYSLDDIAKMQAAPQPQAGGAGYSLDDVQRMQSGTAQPPPPERGGLERVIRGEGMAAQGAQYALADTLGFLPDLVAKGTNAIGLTNIKPGQYAEWARQGMKFGGLIPTMTPENKTEEVAQGIGHGAGEAVAGMGAGALLSGAARAGSVAHGVGEALQAAPATQVASGAVGGGVTEATDNPWYGMAAGAAVPFGVKLASKVLNPITPQLTPELQRLRAYGEGQGITFTPGEATGSKPLQVVESTLEQLPGSSAAQGALKQEQARQFNRASMGYSSTPGDYPTANVTQAQRDVLGGTIGDIASRNNLNLSAPVPVGNQAGGGTRPLLDELQDINRQARLNSTTQVAGPVENYTRELVQHIQPNGTIPGPFYRQFDTQLGKAIKNAASSDVAGGLSDLRTAIRNGFDASVSPADSDLWHQTRREYANLMTTRDAMSGAGQQVAAGNLPPAALKGALDRSMGRGSYGAGAGDQNDLARLGQSSLMRPPVSDSGTGIRSGAIQALTGNSFIGRGVLAGATALGLPALAQRLINSDAGRHYLINGLAPGMRGYSLTQSLGPALAQRLMDAQRQQ